MALEGTHILIAKEVAQELHVQDFDAYYSGTIYPDSRYLTKTERELTHPVGYQINHDLDDFTKGWYLHLRADEIQYKLFAHAFPKELQTEQDTQWWYRLTAIKVVQDAILFNEFPYQDLLSFITYHANPVGEDAKLVKEYNEIVQKFYTRDGKITYDDYKDFWHEFDPDNVHLGGIFDEVNILVQQDGIEEKLLELHNQLIQDLRESVL